MSNITQLFGQEKIESPAGPDRIVAIAVTDISASHAQLARTIKALSEHLDALDHITGGLSDSDTRARYQQVVRMSREGLTNAMLDLSQLIAC
jgi:hypothetical protein